MAWCAVDGRMELRVPCMGFGTVVSPGVVAACVARRGGVLAPACATGRPTQVTSHTRGLFTRLIPRVCVAVVPRTVRFP
eukprot:7035968-Prymnesium_polylepis.1